MLPLAGFGVILHSFFHKILCPSFFGKPIWLWGNCSAWRAGYPKLYEQNSTCSSKYCAFHSQTFCVVLVPLWSTGNSEQRMGVENWRKFKARRAFCLCCGRFEFSTSVLWAAVFTKYSVVVAESPRSGFPGRGLSKIEHAEWLSQSQAVLELHLTLCSHSHDWYVKAKLQVSHCVFDE